MTAASDEDHPRKPIISAVIGHFVWADAGEEAEAMLTAIKRSINPPDPPAAGR